MADGKITIDTEINQKGAEKGTQNLQKKLDGTAQKAKSVGGNMTKYLTAPMVALGGASFSAAANLDAAYKDIQVATGATGDELEDLKDTFNDVFSSVPDSAETVSGALGTIQTITGATGETLEGLTKNVLDASRSLGEDGAENAQAFSRAMEQWQIPAEEGQGKLDNLFKITQDYDVALGEISSHLTEYGSVLQNAGFDMDESADLMGRLEASGLSVSRVMPGLNQAFRNWASEGKNSREEFDKTIQKMQDAEDETDALAIATEEFGAEGAQRMTTAVRNEAIPALDDLGKGAEDSKGLIQETSDETKTIGEQFKEFGNQAALSLQPLGEILLELAEKALPPVINAVTTVAEWFKNLPGPVQIIIVAIGALMAILGPLLVMFGMIAGAITAITAPFLLWTVVIGAVIAIVITLAVVLTKNWDKIKERTVIVWNAIKEFFMATWEWIKNAFSATVEWIKNAASTAWNWIKETTQTVWNGIKDFFTSLWEGIKNTFNSIIEGIKTAIQSSWNWIKDTTSSIWNGIKDFFTSFWDGIKNVFKTVVQFLQDRISNAWQWIKNLTSTIWNGIKNTVTSIWNGIKSAATFAFNFVKDSISNVWNAVKNVTSSVWNGIKSTVTGIWNGLKSSVSNVFNGIKSTITNVWNSIKRTTSRIWNGIVDSIKGAINGVIRSINGMLNGVGDISISLPTVPDWVPGIGGSGGQSISFPSVPNIPSLDVGTNFVAQDGLAMLHQGEAVVPKEYNPAADGEQQQEQKQPVHLHLHLATSTFKGFVKDITKVQETENFRLQKSKG